MCHQIIKAIVKISRKVLMSSQREVADYFKTTLQLYSLTI